VVNLLKHSIKSFLIGLTLFILLISHAAYGIQFTELSKQVAAITDKDLALKRLLEEKNSMDLWSAKERGQYFTLLGLQQEKLALFEQASKSYTGAIVNLETIPVSIELIEAYINRSYMHYIKTNDPAVYCKDRHTALLKARELKDAEYLAKSLTSVAFCFSDGTKFREGLALLEEAAAISVKELLSVNRKAMIYNATGVLYRNNQIIDMADEYFEKAYSLWESIDDRQDMFNLAHSMVATKILMGRWQEANQHVNILFELANSSPEFSDFYFFAHYNAGLLAFKQKKYLIAIENFKKVCL